MCLNFRTRGDNNVSNIMVYMVVNNAQKINTLDKISPIFIESWTVTRLDQLHANSTKKLFAGIYCSQCF